MNDELENLFPVEEEVIDVPAPAPVVEPEPEPTPEPTVEPVVEPEPTPVPVNSSVKIDLGKAGEKSTATYESNNSGCEPLNAFQSVTAVILKEGKEIYRLAGYKKGLVIFKTPEAGNYSLRIVEGWTDFVSNKSKSYPEVSFTVE